MHAADRVLLRDTIQYAKPHDEPVTNYIPFIRVYRPRPSTRQSIRREREEEDGAEDSEARVRQVQEFSYCV